MIDFFFRPLAYLGGFSSAFRMQLRHLRGRRGNSSSAQRDGSAAPNGVVISVVRPKLRNVEK
jgi:hypothetical protein